MMIFLLYACICIHFFFFLCIFNWWTWINERTNTHTHTHAHIHVWGVFRGIGYLAAKLGTWIIPHFHGVYTYDVPRNNAISRPKMCKKSYTTDMIFYRFTGKKNRTSNNTRGHPIACILPPRLLNQRFLDLRISPLFLNSPLTWDEVCVCPRKPPLYIHTLKFVYVCHTLKLACVCVCVCVRACVCVYVCT